MTFITKTTGYSTADYRKMCDALDTVFKLAHSEPFTGADAETVSGLVRVFLSAFATRNDLTDLGHALGCGSDPARISYAAQDHVMELATLTPTDPFTLAQYLASSLGLPDPHTIDTI